MPIPIRRLVGASAAFGAGFGLIVLLGIGAAYQYKIRPIPWNTTALTAQFVTVEFKTGLPENTYEVAFDYDLKNNTSSNYAIVPSNLVWMAQLSNSKSLSKEFGHYQISDPVLIAPKFIPPYSSARIGLHLKYQVREGKSDFESVQKSLNRRLQELSGFVAFDQANHYQVNLPEGWQNWEDVKKSE